MFQSSWVDYRPLNVDCAGTPPIRWGLVLVLIVDCAGRPPFL